MNEAREFNLILEHYHNLRRAYREEMRYRGCKPGIRPIEDKRLEMDKGTYMTLLSCRGVKPYFEMKDNWPTFMGHRITVDMEDTDAIIMRLLE